MIQRGYNAFFTEMRHWLKSHLITRKKDIFGPRKKFLDPLDAMAFMKTFRFNEIKTLAKLFSERSELTPNLGEPTHPLILDYETKILLQLEEEATTSQTEIECNDFSC